MSEELRYVGPPVAEDDDLAYRKAVSDTMIGGPSVSEVDSRIADGLLPYATKAYADLRDQENATTAYIDLADSFLLKKSQINVPNGIAGLNSSGRVPDDRVDLFSLQDIPRGPLSPSSLGSTVTLSSSTNSMQMFSVNIPDPGYRYRLMVFGSFPVSGSSTASVRARIDGGSGIIVAEGFASSGSVTLMPVLGFNRAAVSGAKTLHVYAAKTGTASATFENTTARPRQFSVHIVPVGSAEPFVYTPYDVTHSVTGNSSGSSYGLTLSDSSTRVDVVVVGAGGDGMSASLALPGYGGSGGSWNWRTVRRGIDIPWTSWPGTRVTYSAGRSRYGGGESSASISGVFNITGSGGRTGSASADTGGAARGGNIDGGRSVSFNGRTYTGGTGGRGGGFRGSGGNGSTPGGGGGGAGAPYGEPGGDGAPGRAFCRVYNVKNDYHEYGGIPD